MKHDIYYAEKLNTLRKAELFQNISDDTLSKILEMSQSRLYTSDSVVFRQDEPAVDFGIIHSGVLEIRHEEKGESKIVTYLGPGACVGELALLMGSNRTATARVPELAEVILIPGKLFEEMLRRSNVVLRQLCSVLAKRVHRTTRLTAAKPEQDESSCLEGSLELFDLAVVLQTLLDARKTGQLEVLQEDGTPGADLRLEHGNITYARLKHIRGEEAVYQLFQRKLEGRFRFTGKAPDLNLPINVREDPMSIILEATRLQDELSMMRTHFPDTSVFLSKKVPRMEWEDSEDKRFAEPVWEVLEKRPHTLKELLSLAPYSHARIYKVAWVLLQSRQIEIGKA